MFFLPPCCTLQELAVEDMRHELDDEGCREFFEEQDEDVEGGSRGGNERCLSPCNHPNTKVVFGYHALLETTKHVQ